jgi:hypothetical protein
MENIQGKICPECQTFKRLSDFNKLSKSNDGLDYWCKHCFRQYHSNWRKSHPESVKWSSNKYHQANRKKMIIKSKAYHQRMKRERPDYVLKQQRKRSLAKLYGLSTEEYNIMFESQRGLCAVCCLPDSSRRDGRLSVDHNHKTGKIRQLLCTKCNLALGAVGDKIENLLSMIEYIKKHKDAKAEEQPVA